MYEDKSIWLAGILSFIISGVGQLYAGAYRIGIFFMVFYILLIIGAGLPVFHVVARVLFVLGILVLWAAGVIHAVLYTRKVANGSVR